MLIIIGLIIGGILARQELIAQTIIRGVISEIQSFKAAINIFKIQHSFPPGDLPDAQNIFGTLTNNSNGNGAVEQGVPSITNATINEGLLAWQHMSLALPQQYSRIHTLGGTIYIIGVDIPGSKYSNNSGYFFDNHSCYTDMNYMTLGGLVSNNVPYGPLLLQTEIYQIDLKTDDAIPKDGKLRSKYFDTRSCVASTLRCAF